MISWNLDGRYGKQKGYGIYTRRCKRCDRYYKTEARSSKVCEKCNIKNINKKRKLKIKKAEDKFNKQCQNLPL